MAPDGTFSAVVNRKRISRASVSAVKKEIDKLDAFDSFTGLYIQWGEIKEVLVVGISAGRKSRYGTARKEWITSTGGTYRDLYEDTPEVRKALKDALNLRKTVDEETQRLRDLLDAAWAAIPKRRPA